MMNKRKTYKALGVELVFWIVSFSVLLFVFKFRDSFSAIDYVYTGLFHISLIFVVWINNYFFIPFFVNKGRYVPYLLSIPLIILIGAWLNDIVFSHLAIWLAPGFFFITYHTLEERLLFHLGYLIVGSLPFLLLSWYEKEQLKQELKELQRINIEKEREILSNQIRPHFFFNALNTIYSLSLQNSEKTSQAILDLSEAMRYAVDKGSEEFVSLQDELDGVQAYINFQNLRMENANKPLFEIYKNGFLTDIKIPPFIVLTLVENVYKHADLHQKSSILVEISSDKIEVKTMNASKSEINKNRVGSGLKNLEKRLSLLLGDAFHLTYGRSEDQYLVTLVLFNLSSTD